MKLLFGRGPSLHLRLLLALIISASLMVADIKLDTFAKPRYWLNNLVTPLQYAANLPRSVFDEIYDHLHSRQYLVKENQALKMKVRELKANTLLLTQYKEENTRLRNLLGSPYIRDERKMVAEVMSVDSSPYSHQVVIDKGRRDGVYEGQPLINEDGIVGQVTFVAAHNSRVLLLTDSNSSIPVQVVRNDIRVIASGNGDMSHIWLENVPTSADIEAGDMLLTSGLGGRYPEGYPVARVKKVQNDSSQAFSLIEATPVVEFDRLRYLLLIWPDLDRQNQAAKLDSDSLVSQIEKEEKEENEKAVKKAMSAHESKTDKPETKVKKEVSSE